MPDATDADGLDAVADHLYALRPDEFVPARDDAVTRARSGGDRQLARAVGRLRRPTRAAWLANLLATRRTEQLDGLLALATDLADAQRTLDGATLRALSSQRNRLVAAMAREAGRLAREAGDSATDPMLRDLAGILEAALADPAVADEVRSGRLTRTVSYSGFGPTDPHAVRARREAPGRPRSVPDTGHGGPGVDGAEQDGQGQGHPEQERAEQEHAEQERAEQERAEQERADRKRRDRERAAHERAVADAEQEEAVARARHEDDEAARGDAEAAHDAARDHVAVLSAELDAARARERAVAATARTAAATAKDSARATATAATHLARVRARLDEQRAADQASEERTHRPGSPR